MTLAEKVGQMTQLDITLINTTGKQNTIAVDEEKARHFLKKHHIGSFLNGEAASPETWQTFTSTLFHIAQQETRLGIPIIYGIDHMHGASYVKGATIFPHNSNLGATFNPAHAAHCGSVTALEAGSLGHHWIFAPVLDIGVQPLWARFYETYSEDPHLAGTMGAAFVQGLQNNLDILPYKLAATGKHFLGYSNPKTGWDRTPAAIPMQEIQEFHRPAFQKAIDAGLKTIMLNSGEVNGVPVHASSEFIEDVLRRQMGFEGVVITDWDDIGKLVDFHFVAPNYKEATYQSVMAGIDVCMTPLHLKFTRCLIELVEEGRIPVSRIDQSVRRMLRLKYDLGLFNPKPALPLSSFCEKMAENKEKARKAAEESLVLLKNHNELLPLQDPKRIALAGPSANSKRNLAGGWTIAWQGGSEDQYPADMHTIFSALQREFPASEIILLEDHDLPDSRSASKARKKSFSEFLAGFDVIMYAGGEEPYAEFAGNITDLNLPKKQQEQLNVLGSSSTPVLLLLIQGRPRLITSLIENIAAVIHAGLPGFEGAEAIAGLLSGRVSPCGKLPFSYPLHPNHHIPYNHKRSQLYFFDINHANYIKQANQSLWLFPFGFGLSYTKFTYSDLTLSTSRITGEESLTARVTVTNIGKTSGQESILWFTSTPYGKITRPIKELKHVSRIFLEAGESWEVSFTLHPNLLAYPDANGEKILQNGEYDLLVGQLNAKFELS